MNEPNRPIRPILSVAISPRADSDLLGLMQALADLVEEDQTLQINTDGQIVIGGMSDLHLETVCDRIEREYKIQLDVDESKVAYLETVRRQAEGEGKYIRQIGGSGNYGHCKLRIEPNESGRGYEFINDIKGGVVPMKYVNSIDDGVQGAAECGILAGYAMTDIKVTLFDGSYHDIDSNEMAFRFAGAAAFKDAAKKASPVLLEPVMAVEVTALEELLGVVIGDINSRRGRIAGMKQTGGFQVIHAEIPLAEMLGYRKDLRSFAQGRAHHSARFARYETAPLRGGPGRDGAGVTANKPKGPSGGSHSAAVDPYRDTE